MVGVSGKQRDFFTLHISVLPASEADPDTGTILG
jgi:hypothetical protein